MNICKNKISIVECLIFLHHGYIMQFILNTNIFVLLTLVLFIQKVLLGLFYKHSDMLRVRIFTTLNHTST